MTREQVEMPIGIIIMAAAMLDRTTTMIVAAFVIICKLCAYMGRSKLELHYDTKNKFF